tara:strand:- start:1307 stop:4288 length:2982 start_codon:yes stop_codon:yes gene_type:complete
MIGLTPIASEVQRKLFEKMEASGKEKQFPNDPTIEKESGTKAAKKAALREKQKFQGNLATRSTFIKMVSGLEKDSVVLMGGELRSDNDIVGGFDEIYGSRMSVTEDMEKSMLYGRPIDTQNPTSRPIPGVKSIDVKFKGGMKAIREATISWTCWSFEDLNRLRPHFLTHGKNVLLEWGWVHDKSSMNDLLTFHTIDETGNTIRREAFKDVAQEIISQGGDMDMMVGVIKNFEYTTRDDGAFDCQTILTSVGTSLIENHLEDTGTIKPKVIVQQPENEAEEEKLFDKVKSEVAKKGKKSLVTYDLNLTLKTFLKEFDDYITSRVDKAKDVSEENFKWNKHDNGKFYYVPNKFIAGYSGTSGQKKGYYINSWVRWGWFEDNVLSNFTSMTSAKTNTVVTEFRSIESDLESGNLSSVRIRNSEFLETMDPLNNYILPGQFSPVTKTTIRLKGGDIELEGDSVIFTKLSEVVNNNFFPFKDPNNSELGFFRNMLVNVKTISEAFESASTINEGITALLNKINSPIDFWNFELKEDELNSSRVKIVDTHVTGVDFKKKIVTQRSTYSDSELINHGIFYFPVWKTNSIVKRQNLTAKIPSAMQLITMYGANLDQLKNIEGPSGTSIMEGVVAGGLGNNDFDAYLSKLDFSFKNFHCVSNASGLATDPLQVSTDTDGVYDFILNNVTDSIFKTMEDEEAARNAETTTAELTKIYTKIEYDETKPVPPPRFTGEDGLQELFALAQYSEGVAKEITSVYGGKYDYDFGTGTGSGKLKEKFRTSIRWCTTTHTNSSNADSNTPMIIPLELELDLDGTGGIYPGNSFNSTYLPENYQTKTVFQIFEVNHMIDSAGWTTAIIGKMRTTVNQVFDTLSQNAVLTNLRDNFLKKLQNEYNKDNAITELPDGASITPPSGQINPDRRVKTGYTPDSIVKTNPIQLETKEAALLELVDGESEGGYIDGTSDLENSSTLGSRVTPLVVGGDSASTIDELFIVENEDEGDS